MLNAWSFLKNILCSAINCYVYLSKIYIHVQKVAVKVKMHV